MPYRISRTVLLCVALLWALSACAHFTSDDARRLGRVYPQPYEQVWAAVEAYVLDDLGCAAKRISRRKGIIETEWVHRLDTEGTQRWQIKAEVRKRKNGVWVVIDRRVQLQDPFSRQITRYQSESNAPGGSNAGWTTKSFDSDVIVDMHRAIDRKL